MTATFICDHNTLDGDPCITCDTPIADDITIGEIVSEQTDSAQIAEMRIEIARLTDIVDKQVAVLEDIRGAMAPLLSKLEANPMFRMLFGGNE